MRVNIILKSLYSNRLVLTGMSALLICLFVLNTVASGLSPSSRFNPIVRIEKRDGEFVIVEDEKAKLDPSKKTFEQDTAFLYLSFLIADVLDHFGGEISAEGLKNLIQQHLPHLDFTNFEWIKLYREGDSFFLPYSDARGTVLLHYYIPESGHEDSPHEVSIPAEGRKVIMEPLFPACNTPDAPPLPPNNPGNTDPPASPDPPYESEPGKDAPKMLTALRVDTETKYMASLRVISALELSEPQRKRAADSLQNWLDFKGGPELAHHIENSFYIWALRNNNRKNLSELFIVLSEDQQKIEAWVTLLDPAGAAIMELAPWNREVAVGGPTYMFLDDEIREFAIKRLLKKYGDLVFSKTHGLTILEPLGFKEGDLYSNMEYDFADKSAVEKFLWTYGKRRNRLISHYGYKETAEARAVGKTVEELELVEKEEEIPFDHRPVKAGLLHEAFVKHDMAVKKTLNPGDKPLVGLYGGAGADVSNYLLSTNATESYFVSRYKGRVTRISRKDLKKCFNGKDPDKYMEKHLNREAYASKFTYGYTNTAALQTKNEIIAGLAFELKALGVDLKKVRVDLSSGCPRLTFRWQYPGADERTYTITLINAELTKPEKYLKIVKRKEIDVYYQRAGGTTADDYEKSAESFIHEIYQRLRPSGYLVTDDYSFNFYEEWYTDESLAFPIAIDEITPPELIDLERGILRVRLPAPFNFEARYYGWHVRIRQKPPRAGLPPVPLTAGVPSDTRDVPLLDKPETISPPLISPSEAEELETIMVLRNDAYPNPKYMINLRLVNASELSESARLRAATLLRDWFRYPGGPAIVRQTSLGVYIEALTYNIEEILSDLYFALSEDYREIEGWVNLDIAPGFACNLKLAPWNDVGMNMIRRYKGLGSELRAFALRKLISKYNGALFDSEHISRVVVLGRRHDMPNLFEYFSTNEDNIRRYLDAQTTARRDNLKQYGFKKEKKAGSGGEKADQIIDPDNERRHAKDLLDTVKARAYAASKQGQNIIIGIDTSWIPAGQRSAIQGLLQSLSDLSQKKGLDNIIIVRGLGELLADNLMHTVESTETPMSNIVILGDTKTLNMTKFSLFRGTDRTEGAFFAEIDLPVNFPENSYINILFMLRTALRTASDGTMPPTNPFIYIIKAGERRILFIPKAFPVDLGELKEIYDGQKQVLAAA